jgi:class 3 adenylate cyclase/predicted ATPase
MFCDLVGSTALSTQLDPEELREVVRAYQRLCASVIGRFEGHLAKYIGDGLLVYFGYPVAHEDEAGRAVQAGLGIVGAISELPLPPHIRLPQPLQVRVGIHTGLVVAGEMGTEDQPEHLAIVGETPNVAARLQGLAAPNTVAISAVTARLVQEAFALENLGPHLLKGMDEFMAVFRVHGPHDADRAEEETPPGGVPFLVGRDEEIGLLRRRWEQSKEGLGQVVLITGEAGIGKSSLVEVIRVQVAQEGLSRITYRCSPYHRNSALYPVITHLERLLRFDRADRAEVKLTKLEQTLQRYSLPLEEVVPLFAALLSVPLSQGRYPALALSPQQQKQQTQDALVAWLLEEAEHQPVLVLWEDLHWADPSTLELLGLVIEQTPTAAMLHVLTFRPEFVPPWPPHSHMTPLTLNRLERRQVEALVTQLAKGKTLPAEMVEYIVAKTDGVPLFVEELTKTLLESTLLQEAADRYVLTGPLSNVAIPATLQDSLMARLDRLPAVREVAQLGAVLGREFAYEMLRTLGVMEEPILQDGLAQLVNAELLYQRGRLPRAKYIFKHALVQDAAYQSLLRRTRQQYHKQVAQMLVTHFPEVVETGPEVVAYHYTEAGCPAQAVTYWQRAGQRAVERSAHVEAIAHFSKGLELLKTLPDTPERTQQELLLHVALGNSLFTVKGYGAPEVERVYSQARELCQHVGDTPQIFPVLRGFLLFYLVRGHLQTAQELAEQLLSRAEHQTEVAPQMFGHYSLGIVLFHRGVLGDAAQHFKQAIAAYDLQQHRRLAPVYGTDLGAGARGVGALPLWLLGYPDRALAQSQEALTLAQELAHPFSMVVALDFAARLHQFCQEDQAAHDRATGGTALATQQGFALYVAWGTVSQGWALTRQEQRAAGIAKMREGIEAAVATGAELFRSYFLALLAEACGAEGQTEEGLRLLADAQDMVARTGEGFYEAELYRLKGTLTLQSKAGLGQVQDRSKIKSRKSKTPKPKSQIPDPQPEAEVYFLKAIEIARHQQAKSLELRAAVSLSRLWQQQGKRAEALALLAPIYGWFTEGFDTADLQEARALLEELGG